LVYSYLLAINPDGTMQWFYPSGNVADHALRELIYPEKSDEYEMMDTPGPVAVHLVVARAPLPEARQWKLPVKPQEWAKLKGSWMYTGRRTEPLRAERSFRVKAGPKGFGEVCDWLQQQPGVAAVRGILFEVKP
jgi:hypothetical protein